MKNLNVNRFKIVLFFSVWAGTLWAQAPLSSIIIQGNKSGSTESYVAKEKITLDNTFLYQADEGLDFSAKIDPHLLDQNPYPTQIISNANNREFAVVGETECNTSVSPSGASIFEMPIKVIPGTGGMAPQLSITYNSQGNDGLLGVGFSISGLSSISRLPNNRRDTRVTSVCLNSEDKFSLDGSRLVAYHANREYGANETEYRTENNSFSKIISYTTTTTGPESFKVYSKSGLIYEYGGTEDSRFRAQSSNHVITWLVNKVTDSKGNYYTITYIQDRANGEYRPSRIDYTGNDSKSPALAPYASVRFVYKDRYLTNATYINGNKSNITKILKSIDIYSQESKVKSYELYIPANSLGKYLLTKITEVSSSGDNLTPIQLDWYTNNTYKPIIRYGYTNSHELRFCHNSTLTIGDFNGDGKSDFIAAHNPGEPVADWGMFFGVSSENNCIFQCSGMLPDGFQHYYSGDFDGDGKTDLLQKTKIRFKDKYNNFTTERYYIVKSNGQSFQEPSFLYCADRDKATDAIVGDFNGDGISDILIYYIGTKDYHLFFSKYYSSPIAYQEEIGTISTNWERVETGDFNGDGLTDIMNLTAAGYECIQPEGYAYSSSFIKTSSTIINKTSKLNFGDFNGDGKTDILQTGLMEPYWVQLNETIQVQKTKEVWKILVSTGVGFSETKFDGYFSTSEKDIIIADLNGDGKDDFYAVKKTGYGYTSMGKMQLYIANSTIGTYNFSLFLEQEGDNACSTDAFEFHNGDFNGDGKADFVITPANDTWSAILLANCETDRDMLMKSVTDSYGNTSSFTYKPLTNTAVYNPYTNGSYPVSDFICAMQVVDKKTQNDGVGGTKSTSYKYAGAKLHKTGIGFLGFSEFTSTDDQTGISTTNFYEYDPVHFAIGLKKNEVRINTQEYTNQLLSETIYTNTYRKYPKLFSSSGSYNEAHDKFLIYTYQPTTTVEKKYELGSTTPYKSTTSSYTFNDYGDVMTSTQSIGTEATISTVNEYINDVSKWYLGRLTKATSTKHVAGQTDVIRVSEFEYDPASGLLTKEIVERNNAKLGYYKTYEHDDFGNILRSTVFADGKSRSQRSVYDVKGRFALDNFDALGHKTSKTYHPYFGTVVTQTDPNLLTAKADYDNFGREKLATGSDGTKGVTAYRWCIRDANTPTGAVWFKYIEVSGKPGAKEYYDSFGRVLRKEAIGFDGRLIFIDTKYNALGQIEQQSDPYFNGETAQWTNFLYDPIGRLKQKTLPDQKTIKIIYNGLTTTTVNPLKKSDIRRANMQGQLVESTDNMQKSITYVYNSAGNMTEVHDSKGNVVKMEYDILGNRTKLIDPELGTTTSDYNAFGELIFELDPKGDTLTLEYDDLGRMRKRIEAEGTTEWTYDTGVCGIGRLALVASSNGYAQATKYDPYGRPINLSETIDGVTYRTVTTYDSFGRVSIINYPSKDGNGPIVRNCYNSYGYLSQVSNVRTGKNYWTAGVMNARGQLVQSLYGNGMQTTHTFDDVTGLLKHIKTAYGTNTVQDWEYQFNDLGNLRMRRDDHRLMEETFEYDDLNRLWYVKKNNTKTLEMSYDELGNIMTKSDVGTYHYEDTNRPHSVTSITPCLGSILKTTDQRINYTSFDKVRTIAQGADSLQIDYGSAYERIFAKSYQNNILVKCRTYVGSLYEQDKEMATGEIKEKFYILGGDGLIAVQITDDTGSKLTYVHKDHLGSMQCLTDESGALVQELSFDAWGNRRNPETWDLYTTTPTGLILDRGFTGHEHIDLFDLVNMDGRVYDPIIGRFLSPDPIIQNLENLQCLNRYSYCLNNPLSLVDPSGYSWLSQNWRSLVTAGVAISIAALTGGIGSGLSAAMIGGALGGFAGGFVGTLLNGGTVVQAFKAGAIGGLIGGVSGFLNYGAGFGTLFERTFKHVFAGAIMNGIQGQNVLHGMISGGLTSFGNGFINQESTCDFLKVTASAVLGGTISEIGGDKFANGAITGAYSMLFNDLMHDVEKLKTKYIKYENRIMANSIVMEALIETTGPGELLTNIRETIGDIYGTENQKEANEVYSNTISILKELKSTFGGKSADFHIASAVCVLAVNTMELQIKESYIAYQIKKLDMNTYNQLFSPWKIRYSSGGGGATSRIK